MSSYKIGEKEYTIVGYFVIPEYSQWKNLAQDTILTISDSMTYGNAVNAYFKLKDPAEYQDFAGTYLQDPTDYLYNKDYIRMQNSADDRRTEFVFTLLAFCAIFVILLLADMLIYNSFSTSSSERVRAIGLLKSVGATRRQVRELLFYEAAYYSVIGIPIGIILGQISSAVLFSILNNMAGHAANYYLAKNINLSYRLCLENVLIPIGYAVLCILMAIFTPMRRMSKIAPIEALRANEVFSNHTRRKKSKGLAVKLLGFTGALSLKNYIRHRRRYRATVISIVTSILMIICANVLVNTVVGQFVTDTENENVITYIRACGTDGFSQEDQNMFYQLASIKGVRSSRLTLDTAGKLLLDGTITDISPEDVTTVFDEDPAARVIFVEDSAFRRLCEEHDIDADPYLEYGSKLCLTNNTYTYYDDYFEMAKEASLFDEYGDTYLLKVPCKIGDEEEIIIQVQVEEKVDGSELSCMDSGEIQFYIPMSRLDYYGVESTQGIEYFYYEVNQPQAVAKEMKKTLEQNLYRSDYLVDLGMASRARESVKRLATTVLYGYVALLSFMCLLNVIMTVIGNIVFRRREYILLTSIGMSRKTLFRMVISESIVYFVESLIMLGLILGVFFLGLIILDPILYSRLRYGFSLVIIFIHFLLVVSTTAIGLSHVMKDEIIESVRKEYY